MICRRLSRFTGFPGVGRSGEAPLASSPRRWATSSIGAGGAAWKRRRSRGRGGASSQLAEVTHRARGRFGAATGVGRSLRRWPGERDETAFDGGGGAGRRRQGRGSPPAAGTSWEPPLPCLPDYAVPISEHPPGDSEVAPGRRVPP